MTDLVASEDWLPLAIMIGWTLMARLSSRFGELGLEVHSIRAEFGRVCKLLRHGKCLLFFAVTARTDSKLRRPLRSSVPFGSGDTILNECSHKHSVCEFEEMAAQVGWRRKQIWTDNRDYFAVMYLENLTFCNSSSTD